MKKKILSFVLSLAIMLAIFPTFNVAVNASGETTVTSSNTAVIWNSGNYVVNDDVTINGGITVNGVVVLSIMDGKTLTVNGSNGTNGGTAVAGTNGQTAIVIAETANFTLKGNGKVNITGGNGGNGGEGSDGNNSASSNGANGSNGATGGNGADAIVISAGAILNINGTTVIATGGAGGIGGTGGDGGNGGNNPDMGYKGGTGGIGGASGNGGNAISVLASATLNVNGVVTATGGAGTQGGTSGDGGNGGNGDIAGAGGKAGNPGNGGNGGSGIVANGFINISSGNIFASGANGGLKGETGAQGFSGYDAWGEGHTPNSLLPTGGYAGTNGKGIVVSDLSAVNMTIKASDTNPATDVIAHDTNLSTNLSQKQYASIVSSNPVCFIDLNGNAKYDNTEIKYTSIDAALKHGETVTTIKDSNTGESDSVSTKIILIDNDTENVTIPAGRNITLDLNGYALKANVNIVTHFVIENNGSLTIDDSGKDKVHYFLDNNRFNGSSFVSGTDGCFETLYTSSGIPSGQEGKDYIKILGGCITGSLYYGAILNNFGAILTLNAGNIVGNEAHDSGTGVSNNGTFNMNGGSISNNVACQIGAGVLNSGILEMTDGSINNNIAYVGGSGVYNCGAFKMTGGVITNNKSEITPVGGVYNEESYYILLGGTAKITGNKAKDNVDSNLVVHSLITIGTGENGNGIVAPTWTTPIGITVLSDEYLPTVGAFTINGSNTDKQYFISDIDDYCVKFVTDHLELAVATVKIDSGIKNGKVEVSDQEAAVGNTVTITAKPEAGYQLDKITVVDKNGNPIQVEEDNTFVMTSDYPVTVSATYKKITPVVGTNVENNNIFKCIGLISLIGIAACITLKKKTEE